MARKQNSTNFLNEQRMIHSCGVSFTLSLIGGRWKAAILFELINGAQRFSDLSRHIEGITERMLALRLIDLEKDKLICRRTEGRGAYYILSPYGESLVPLLREISDWGLENRSLAPNIRSLAADMSK